MTEVTSEARRREVFSRLVEVQDEGVSVAESRQFVAQEFEISLDELEGIEREGITSHWPPL